MTIERIVKKYVKGWFQYRILNSNQRKHKEGKFSSSILSNAEGQVEVSQAKKRAKKITSSVWRQL